MPTSTIITSTSGDTISTTNTTDPEVPTTINSTSGAAEIENGSLFIGVIAGGVPAGVLLVLLLVTLCVLVPVLVRRARLRGKKPLQINTAPNDSDAYAVASTEPTKKNLEYASVPDTTDISTSTAYFSMRSETEPHVYAYDVVPDRGEQEFKQNMAYVNVPTSIKMVANAAYVATGEPKDVPEDYDYVTNYLK